MAKLAVVIFGGPNGSGKSTITKEVRQEPGFPALYINADEIAQRLRAGRSETPEQTAQREFEAMRQAEAQRLQLIAKGESFAFETVMSHPSKVALIAHAKSVGYEVALHFVATSDPQINVERVAERVEDGGHNVDTQKIISRYHRSLSLLPAAAELADLTLVYDNSMKSSDARAQLVARVVDGKVELHATPPAYYQERFITPFVTERPAELEAIRTMLPAGHQLHRADLVKGLSTGRIIQQGKHFVVQEHRAGVFVHDRAALAACGIKLQLGQRPRIAYRQGAITARERSIERYR
jgi:predicted ABC-type ATPase